MSSSLRASFFLGVLAGLGCSTFPREGQAQPGLVGRLDELRLQPAIEIGNGVAVRLGIDRAECPVLSGIHVYCLTRGYTPPRKWGGRRLGPLILSVRPEGGRPEGKGEVDLSEVQRREDPPESGELLFMTLVPIRHAGRTRIVLLTPGGEELAAFHIGAVPGESPPWVHWAKPEKPVEARLAKPGEERTLCAALANSGTGAALPSWGGMAPIAPGSLGPRGLLPTLLPDQIAGDMTLSRQGHDLVIESSRDFITYRPDWRFLTRWWVNGRPFLPGPLKEFGDENGVVNTGKRLLIELEFHPERLGATKGDRIGLQLLYSAAGWQFAEGAVEMLASHDSSPDVRLTNRVEWTLP